MYLNLNGFLWTSGMSTVCPRCPHLAPVVVGASDQVGLANGDECVPAERARALALCAERKVRPMPSESVEAKTPREQAAEVLAVTLLEMLVQPGSDGGRRAGAEASVGHPGSGSGAATPTRDLGSGCRSETAGNLGPDNERTLVR
jgi:hypothetical protein